MLSIFKQQKNESVVDSDIITQGTITRQFASETKLSQDYYSDSFALTAKQFGLVVPSTIHDNPASEIVVNTIVAECAKYIAKIAGGATIIPQYGVYWDDSKGLIEEKSFYVYAYGDNDSLAELSLMVYRLGHIVGKLMSQDSMLTITANQPTLLNSWGD